MNSQGFHSEVVEHQLVVRFVGSLQGSAFAGLKQEILEDLTESIRRVVMDFSDVDYLSSSGIGFLVSILNHCRPLGVEVVIAGLHDDSAEIFRLTRLDQVFDIFPTPEAALEGA